MNLESVRKYIEKGISINQRGNKYDVFTVATQHFEVNDLKDLTPERFELQIQKREKFLALQDQILIDFHDSAECLLDEIMFKALNKSD